MTKFINDFTDEVLEKDEQNACVSSLEQSPFAYTLSLISGKYKMSILYCLSREEVVRYNEMKRYLKGISFKTLTNALRELEADKLIIRKEYPQIPPKVEYSLSKRGKSLIPVLNAMCEWGKKNKEASKI
ncbi:transcriptional regulator [Campylobacter sp. MIT 99-7217]|uniref:winged helix-turn-helix transcriptional regulator n=1 Tax=Campylobacter sp. MIT 99-7217 TaxID=535091 RepID=UPI00115832A6|nr:helix-turn-helix domain-containing protein [Campylobacter sp. MIT 99-7217]TQR31326.1 transcriptional regulator [Campylobacter sp. MIT 99-7217]